MHKLWLKNFEFHINPATWNTAQDLLQAGAVRNLREVEKHFWVALVTDGDDAFEVETIITPHKIKAFTCECWAEGRRLMCAHIAATLYKIRQFLEQQAEARLARAAAQQLEKPGRLSTQTVLEQASAPELLEFVRMYARRDRDFALALKTWFAGSLAGSENPFVLLIDSALPRHPGTHQPREADLRRLRKMLDDLETQLTETAAQGNAQTVFRIATAILQKIAPLIPKTTENKREQLVHYCQTALKQLLQLPSEQLSPELRQNRRQFLLDILRRGAYPVELERDLLHFLGQAATDDALFEQIRDLFDHTPYPAPPPVLHLFLAALARRNMPEAVRRVLEDYAERPARIRDAIVVLFYLHAWPSVVIAGEYFLEKKLFNTGQRREIEDLLLLAAEKTNDQARQLKYLRYRYRENGYHDILQRMKTLAGNKWPAEQKRLVAELQADGNTGRLAPLFAAEGDLESLARLLEEKNDLALLRQYEHLFFPTHLNFIRDRYVDILSAYLTEHFGRQASGFVREQLAGLLHHGQTELVLDIIRTLGLRFADRHTLPEELAELFPKSKRFSILTK